MSKRLAVLIAVAILSALTFVVPAQARSQYPYTLIDLRTFGGPQAGVGNGPYINAAGVGTGTADTALLDPYGTSDNGAFNGDPFVQHTFVWHNGALTNLSALGPDPANNSSYPNAINARGDLAGVSDNGAMDPLTGRAEADAALWKNRQITNLGTLGGNESQAFSINNRDQITGVAANATPDPFSMVGDGTQARAFLWQDGSMRDLGTLGGPDSFGWGVNDRGQVAGVSYTSDIPNPVTGQPPVNVFLWQDGKLRNLGSLGGSVPTFGGVNALNKRGEIAGVSYLAGDQTVHPFLWDGNRMVDLGTLGGDNGIAADINQLGDVVGAAQASDKNWHGFLWHNGNMVALPPVGRAPWAFVNNVNNHDEAVGIATDTNGNGLFPVLWRCGHGYDLNALIAPSRLRLTDAIAINDAGEIIGEGVLNGEQREFLLIPNPAVPLPQTSTPARPLPTTGVRDKGAATLLAPHPADRGDVASHIRQLILSLRR